MHQIVHNLCEALVYIRRVNLQVVLSKLKSVFLLASLLNLKSKKSDLQKICGSVAYWQTRKIQCVNDIVGVIYSSRSCRVNFSPRSLKSCRPFPWFKGFVARQRGELPRKFIA